MKKEDCIKLFNTKLKEFLNDLISVYPSDDDLYKFKTSLNMLNIVNEKQGLKYFKEMVYDKYSQRILDRDENFFLTHTYSEEISQTENMEMEVTSQLIDKVKTYWATMNDENKVVVWNYFILLIKLCEKYVEQS
jgi:hypothetical protein